MQEIITPKRMPPLRDKDWPLYFIGGPVLGGADWQVRMCRSLADELGPHDHFVAVPCHWDKQHKLSTRFISGPQFPHRQTSWERMLLTEAGEERPNGCNIFYLAKQREPRAPEAGVYARDTLGEIGEWRGRMISNPRIRLVIGADPDFDPNGISVMKCNFDEALGYDFPIYEGIEDTARAAVAKTMG